MDKRSTLTNEQILLEILGYKRPAGSRSEKKMIRRFIDPIHGMNTDLYGNRWIDIGKDPETLFSCHTDTVHKNGGRQTVYIDPIKNHAFSDGEDILGADDGAGIYIMLCMIRAGIEGRYIFHRAEECGGLGSSHIASNEPWLLDGIERAIAFDRMGTDSIITFQGWDRCCSETFAEALGDQLGMFPDNTGIFTDTANYTDLVPECTNVSVGYEGHHTKNETLDLAFVDALIYKLAAVDWEALPTKRRAGTVEPLSMRDYGSYGAGKDRDYRLFDTLEDALEFGEYSDVLDSIDADPVGAADLLVELWEERRLYREVH